MPNHPRRQALKAEPMDKVDVRIQCFSHLDIQTLGGRCFAQGCEQCTLQAYLVLSDGVQNFFWHSRDGLSIAVQAAKVVKPATGF